MAQGHQLPLIAEQECEPESLESEFLCLADTPTITSHCDVIAVIVDHSRKEEDNLTGGNVLKQPQIKKMKAANSRRKRTLSL